ncbi:MAG: ubiquinol-cytochrome C chaperone family protein [Dongiaceae bacterium]
MILSLLKRKPTISPAIVHRLYLSLVDAARRPVFYQQYGVPDTIDGRFDMLCLHMAITIYCLNNLQETTDLKQQLFDLMFQDMDHNLREMGVGDLGVPRRIKAMMLAFNGRVQTYSAAFEMGDNQALAGAISRNIYREQKTANEKPVQDLAAYIRRQIAALQAQGLPAFQNAEIKFIAPEI